MLNARNSSKPLFALGTVYVTQAAMAAMERNKADPPSLLIRHQHGDWGRLPPADVLANNHAVKKGFAVLSSFSIAPGVRIWIATDGKRTTTTLLLPHESKTKPLTQMHIEMFQLTLDGTALTAPATQSSLPSRDRSAIAPRTSNGQINLTATPAAYRASFDRKIAEIRKANAEHLFCEVRGDHDNWYPQVWPAAIFTISRDGIDTDLLNDLMNFGTNALPFGFYVGDVESFGRDCSFVALTETSYFEEGGAMMPVVDAIALAIRRLTTNLQQSK